MCTVYWYVGEEVGNKECFSLLNIKATKATPVTANRLTGVVQFYILPLLGYGSATKSSFAVLKTEEALVLCHLSQHTGPADTLFA